MRHLITSFAILILSFPASALKVETSAELERLYKKFDKDKDKKITVDDRIPDKATFILKTIPPLEVTGVYHLSNLAQELKLSELQKSEIRKEKIFENPVDRISRSIRERFWDGLTRKIDLQSLPDVIEDSKVENSTSYLYVPATDKAGLKYFRKEKFKEIEVIELPEKTGQGFVNSLGKKQGLLALALQEGKGVPYVVPGGRFNEMYGWDSYFHVLGTIQDNRLDLARGMIDNFVYEITHYGKILNANRTYYLSRSQPPFFTSMVKAYIQAASEKDIRKDWIEAVLKAALKEYHTVWMGKQRLTATGLSRYAGFDQGIPPEVEPGHFDHVLKPFATKLNITIPELIKKINSGSIKDPELIAFFEQDRAVRESGHDTTYRWRVGEKDRASDFVTVDLNSLLYKYELDMAFLLDKYFKGEFQTHKSSFYRDAAEKRKKLIRDYLWNPEKGMFFDYNWKLKKQSDYISATMFYPLWASHGYSDKDKILSKKEAEKLIHSGLKNLEEKGGLAATAEASLSKVINKDEDRQWDYPNGWAPHQILAWKGFSHYGHDSEAQRIAYKWLYMITKNARDYNGTIPEKYNVVNQSHKVFAEYGNVGTEFSYITMEGFGWMNASYQIGLDVLTQKQTAKLKKMTPPSEMKF